METTQDNSEVIQGKEMIYLAVKPFTAKDVLEEMSPVFCASKNMLISVAAGITLKTMESVSILVTMATVA